MIATVAPLINYFLLPRDFSISCCDKKVINVFFCESCFSNSDILFSKMLENKFSVFKESEFWEYATKPITAWKVSKYGVIAGPYFPAFGLNTERYFVFSPNAGKYGPEITPYFGTFHAVKYCLQCWSEIPQLSRYFFEFFFYVHEIHQFLF